MAKRKTAKRGARKKQSDDARFLIVADSESHQVFVGTAIPVIEDAALWKRVRDLNLAKRTGVRAGIRVLIVDDDPAMVKVLGGNLGPPKT